jgi:hypothetical protein
MVLADRIDIMLFRFADATTVVARGRGTAAPVMLGGSATGSSTTMSSGDVGSRRESLRAKLMKLEGRDWVLGVGTAETAGDGFGVMEKAANILSITLPTVSLAGGRDRRDRLFSCFSLRSSSTFRLSFSSRFLSLASSFFLFLFSRFSQRVVLFRVVLDELGRRSCGTKPGGYETMWMECGRRGRDWVSGAGKCPGSARRLRSAGRFGV